MMDDFNNTPPDIRSQEESHNIHENIESDLYLNEHKVFELTPCSH